MTREARGLRSIYFEALIRHLVSLNISIFDNCFLYTNAVSRLGFGEGLTICLFYV